MDWTFEIKKNNFLSPSQQSLFLSQPPPPPILQSDNFRVENKISPSILLIIIILAIIFFISGLLHLLVRFLMRPSNRDPEVSENATALQGQLQQLFNLHDAGVDQSFIDTLPVFVYKTIIGVKNPFDCAVCLCEFEAEDKLRLLPKCSHAFHMECIDTWLLSHSTCPLCRGSLLPDFPPDNNTSPIVLVLESGSESSRELVPDREPVLGTNNREDNNEISQKSCEIPEKEECTPVATVNPEEVVVPVKLGKFRNVDVSAGGGAGDSSSNSNVDARRCFSMGSFEYVLDENSSLQVAIRSPVKKHTSRKPSLPLTPGRRPAMSECDCNSSREGFKDFDAVKGSEVHGDSSFRIGREVGRNKTESFSVSKIWLRSKKEKPTIVDSSRRASSFRLPLHWTSADDLKQKHNNSSGRTITDIDVARWENGGSGLGLDEEVGSSVCQDSQANPPSFGRRTLLWLGGRQNKVGHLSSSPTNV